MTMGYRCRPLKSSWVRFSRATSKDSDAKKTKKKTYRPLACVCGHHIDTSVRHVTLECGSPLHTITPAAFRQRLIDKYGIGWWSPTCLLEGACGCPPSGYSCHHLTHCFAPHHTMIAKPLRDWAMTRSLSPVEQSFRGLTG